MGKWQGLAAVLVGSAFIAGCNQKNAYVAPPLPKVTVATPTGMPVTIYADFTGNTAPVASVDLEARVEGFLETINYLDGAPVIVSDYVLVHGISHALNENDLNEAHRKLLMDLAPLANDLSEFTFGFAAAIFKKYIGHELTMSLVAKIADAPDIGDLRLPFYVETPGLRNK